MGGTSAGTDEVAFQTGCTQPCTVVDLLSTMTSLVRSIKFKVKTHSTGLVETAAFTSTEITINVECDASSSTIQVPALSYSQSIDQNDVTTTYSFPLFTCSVQTCCEGSHTLAYDLVTTNGGSIIESLM